MWGVPKISFLLNRKHINNKFCVDFHSEKLIQCDILSNEPSLNIVFQESAVCEPPESELCQSSRFCTKHHSQSAIYER